MQGLIHLKDRANSTFLDNCKVPAASLLTCDAVNRSLPVNADEGVYICNVSVGIRVCNSSLKFSFIDTNGERYVADNVQNNTMVPAGNLNFLISADTCIGLFETVEVTTAVSANSLTDYE